MASSVLDFTPSLTDIERYARLRKVSMRLNHKIIEATLPRAAVVEMGRRLGLVKGRTLVLDTEDQMSVVMDLCLYDLVQDGKNAIERYAERYAPPPRTEEYEVLQAMLQARYRIMLPQLGIEGAGVQCVDVLTREELFLMDFGLSRCPLDVALGTRAIPLGRFWMTGGAGLPAHRESIEEALARLQQQGLLRNDRFTDPHRAAITIVRAFLEGGASEYVEYQNLPEAGSPAAETRHAHRQSRPTENVPGRNSACSCGSGKRYKRCCGRK